MRWGLGLAAVAAGAWLAVTWLGLEPHGERVDAEEPAIEGGSVCTLHQVDRARTPSRSCIGCHDGSVGAAIPFQMRHSDLGASHPVDVSYDAAAAKKPGEYVPSSRLPPDVPLVEGKVACTSCHDGQSTEPRQVVNLPNLCLACHIK